MPRKKNNPDEKPTVGIFINREPLYYPDKNQEFTATIMHLLPNGEADPEKDWISCNFALGPWSALQKAKEELRIRGIKLALVEDYTDGTDEPYLIRLRPRKEVIVEAAA